MYSKATNQKLSLNIISRKKQNISMVRFVDSPSVPIPFWLNWNDSWYLVVTVFSWFFEIFDKNDIEAKIYSTWECKEANFHFSFRKGQFPFYCNCKLLYLFHSTLSQLNRRRMFSVLFTKKKTISGFFQTFFPSFEMEVIKKSDPGESIGLKFISSVLPPQ